MAARRQLLAVDDREADREIMSRILGAAYPDADVHGVSDPATVEKICEGQHYDCVLLDYEMPGTNGMTVARKLRKTDPYLPIILITGAGDEMLASDAIRSGVSDYVVKSRLTPEAIRRIVDRAIHATGQQRLIDQQHEELETFAYALAHDFKQPIRQIMTFSQMISDELRDVEHASVQKHLGFLTGAAGRLDNLVDVMVQYTLLSQPPALTDVALDTVLRSIRGALTPLLAELQGELVVADARSKVRGNQTLMIQVLQNLIVNGLRYNASEVPRVEVVVRSDNDDCVIEVRDNGVGIAPEHQSEIFKPLIRLHTHKEYPGSGLGLTLARKAILAQRGDIWCESAPGRGSVFSVRVKSSAARGKRRLRAG